MIDTLHEYRWVILVVDILAWVWLFWALNRSPTLPATALASGPSSKPLGRKPGDIVPQHRTTTGPLAPSIEAGKAEHHLRSAAATAKLQPITDGGAKAKPTESLKAVPPPPPTPEQLKLAEQKLPSSPRPTTTSGDDNDAMEGLFASLKPTPEASTNPGTGVIKKANRLEELGFHHEIQSDRLPASPAEPPKPRSQTAELDDILKRIDQVLADNPAPAAPAAPAARTPDPVTPKSPAAIAPASPSAPAQIPPAAPVAKKTPSWARADIQDEDLEPNAQRNAPTEDLSVTPDPPKPPPKRDDNTGDGEAKKPDDTQQKLF
ncbi:MAG: hypothetical protein H0V44_04285 [Planctomycetes bacterium]|nr:hypothetical protein [Planctomycetota bacterium]